MPYLNSEFPGDVFSIEAHPFGSFITEKTTHIIIGTFPTHKRNSKFDFFYSNEQNNFWEILARIFNKQFLFFRGVQAVEERKDFLAEIKLGLTDVLEVCYRKNNGSSDTDLYPIKIRDIFKILSNYPTIKCLILTSRTEVFGSLGLLKTYFIQNESPFPELSRKPNKVLEGVFEYEHRKIQILVPYSPSPKVIEQKRTTLAELISMYSYCLSR